MYINVKQLAEKVNNLQRFTMQELKQEIVFEIDLLDDNGNIFDYKYLYTFTENDHDKIKQLSIEFCNAAKKAWNKNLEYKFYRIK